MKMRTILLLATIAISMVVLAPISMAASYNYPTPETYLNAPWNIDWPDNSNPYHSQDVNAGDTISWVDYYQNNNADPATPRLNWDSSGGSSGSTEATWTINNGHGGNLGASLTVSDGSSSHTIDNAVTYHKAVSPYNNAIAQSYRFSFY